MDDSTKGISIQTAAALEMLRRALSTGAPAETQATPYVPDESIRKQSDDTANEIGDRVRASQVAYYGKEAKPAQPSKTSQMDLFLRALRDSLGK